MRVVTGPTDRIVIVGAGLGGLAAALHLAAGGRQVTVVEQADGPGGRAGVLRDAGYAFDTGPSVLTMPDLIDEALGAVGESLADRLTLHRLDPAYRARFSDGSALSLFTDTDAMAEHIVAECGARDAAGYRRMVRWLRRLYAVEMPHFIDRNIDHPVSLLGKPMLELLALGGLRRLGPVVDRFVADPRLRRMFTFQAMYAGLAPTQALALYGVITYMDSVAGVYFPVGGMNAVPRALAAAAADHGVVFRYGTRVERVEVASGRARAVLTADGDRIAADAVVINADLPEAYRTLLSDEHTPRRVRTLRYSPSCVVLHAGSRAAYGTDHHTIDFGRNWDTTFDQIIERNAVMSDPSFLVTRPSLSDPGLAPAGRHSYYVLFPAPNLAPRRGRPLDWDALTPRYRETIMRTLDGRGYPGFADHAEVVHTVTPATWQQQGLAAGAPFAAAHTFGQTGPFRAPTLDRRVENLVFCGSNTQPGVGVPMVLLSGKLAAQRITGAPAPARRVTRRRPRPAPAA